MKAEQIFSKTGVIYYSMRENKVEHVLKKIRVVLLVIVYGFCGFVY